jgi:hypothetical protein
MSPAASVRQRSSSRFLARVLPGAKPASFPGFIEDHKTAGEIRRVLEPLARPTAPLAKQLKKQDTTWVEPRFDAEITYAEITDDRMVGHPSFKRLVQWGRDSRAMLKKPSQGEPDEGLYPHGR